MSHYSNRNNRAIMLRAVLYHLDIPFSLQKRTHRRFIHHCLYLAQEVCGLPHAFSFTLSETTSPYAADLTEVMYGDDAQRRYNPTADVLKPIYEKRLARLKETIANKPDGLTTERWVRWLAVYHFFALSEPLTKITNLKDVVTRFEPALFYLMDDAQRALDYLMKDER